MPYYRIAPLGVCAQVTAAACLETGPQALPGAFSQQLARGLAALREAIWSTTQTTPTTALRVPGQASRVGNRRTTVPLPLQPPSGSPTGGGTFGPHEPGRHRIDLEPDGEPPDRTSNADAPDGDPLHEDAFNDDAVHGASDSASQPRGEIWDVVQRAQQGDAEAFGEIYDCYLDTVYRYIFFRVGSKTLAEDLTSETFLRALRRISSVTWQGRDLGAWLVTIARNLIADHYKSGRNRLELATDELVAEDHIDQSVNGQPEAQVIDRLTNQTLLEAVTELGEEQRECIVLRFLDGLSVSETAQAMGKNDGAIKALQYRAVRTLARLLPEGFMQ